VGYKRQEETRHRPLFELATAQHGVVSTRQLKSVGYGRSSASKANRVGRLRRIYRGVYAVGHEPLTWEGRCMAAVLAARPAVASHLSAAYLLDLIRFRPETIDVTAPSGRRSRRDFRVHDAPLNAADMTVAGGGIPIIALRARCSTSRQCSRRSG
jgi:predicted transcriptional regulator of viral defense system